MKVTDEHYGITYHQENRRISNIYCKFCDFIVWRPRGKIGKGKSGLGKFNRMRGEMVKHLHKEHRNKLAS